MTFGSDPFDFTDFGGRGSASSPRTDTQPRPYSATGGFDPFAGEPPLLQPPVEKARDASAGQMTTASISVARPPMALAIAALAFAIVGVALGAVAAFTDSSALLAFVGWLLAGPAAIGVLACFTHIDTRRRLNSVYSAPTWLSTGYWGVVATCGIGIALGAWQIALWAGR